MGCRASCRESKKTHQIQKKHSNPPHPPPPPPKKKKTKKKKQIYTRFGRVSGDFKARMLSRSFESESKAFGFSGSFVV